MASESHDFMDIYRNHCDEVVVDPETMKINPRWDLYRELEQEGRVISIKATDENGDVIGYSINLINPSLHYGDLVFFQNDMIYLAPEHRKGRAGLKLVKVTEEVGRILGVDTMIWHAKENSSLDKIFRRLPGYKVQDVLHSKALK